MTVPALNIILAFEMLFTGKTIADSIVLSITATAGVVLSTIAMYYVDKFRNDGKVGRLKLQIAAQSGVCSKERIQRKHTQRECLYKRKNRLYAF